MWLHAFLVEKSAKTLSSEPDITRVEALGLCFDLKF